MVNKKWFKNRCKKTVMVGKNGELHLHRWKNTRECEGGCGRVRWHDTVEEAIYCNKLKALKDGGYIQDYFSQVPYQLKDSIGKNCGYMRVDFEVIELDGSTTVHEYKGLRSHEWELKKALFSFNYPSVKYEVKTAKDLF